MSSVYSLEPPTQGKVILTTNFGNVEIELWAKEAPKATRNFVQLCLEGYYDKTIFHRIIKDFIVQGGDPTGTGTGGESIYGKPFKDEFHSRLRFTHRGILACANQNQKHTNNSQFFITLTDCEFLNKKHTIFGKVVGDTFFNLTRIAEVIVDEEDRPVEDPPMIISTEVLWNPFDDIQPRIKPQIVSEIIQKTEETKPIQKKNVNLLSFMDEAEEEEHEESEGGINNFVSKGMVSAHDILVQDERFEQNEEIAQKGIQDVKEKLELRRQDDQQEKDKMSQQQLTNLAIKQRMQLRTQKGYSKIDDAPSGNPNENTSQEQQLRNIQINNSGIQRQEQDQGQNAETDKVGQQEIDKVGQEKKNPIQIQEIQKDQFQKFGPIKRKLEEFTNKSKTTKRLNLPKEIPNTDLLTPYQAKLEQYKAKQKVRGKREKETVNNLNQFLQKMRKNACVEAKLKVIEKKEQPAYSGQVLDVNHDQFLPGAWRVEKYIDDEDIQGNLSELRQHQVNFVVACLWVLQICCKEQNVGQYLSHQQVFLIKNYPKHQTSNNLSQGGENCFQQLQHQLAVQFQQILLLHNKTCKICSIKKSKIQFF
eukprot:TRINITY_DN6150_c1_g2_i5.p1 TRINITY_DN6150_c1_g2~~TRINITY_DN6150_c1_g2_i5.p1  ORF type:complete len:590 (-),score=74.95 TRINITY_DN6150_c1_g2_i5:881-2650(-)